MDEWKAYLKSSLPVAAGVMTDEATYEITSLIIGLT